MDTESAIGACSLPLARASPLSLRKRRSIYGTRRACSLPLAAPLHHPPVAALRRPPVAALRRPPVAALLRPPLRRCTIRRRCAAPSTVGALRARSREQARFLSENAGPSMGRGGLAHCRSQRPYTIHRCAPTQSTVAPLRRPPVAPLHNPPLRPYTILPLRPYAVRPLRPCAVRPLRRYAVRRRGAAPSAVGALRARSREQARFLSENAGPSMGRGGLAHCRSQRPYTILPLRRCAVRRRGAASALARASPLSLRKRRSIYETRRACSLPLAAPLHHPPVAALRRPPVAPLHRPPVAALRRPPVAPLRRQPVAALRRPRHYRC